jgi:hypothetical protein
VKTVKLADIRAYLRRTGWRVKPYPRPETLVFAGPLANDGEPILVVLPSSEQATDYPLRLLEAITTLADLEDRPAVGVLNDVLAGSPPGMPGTQGPKGNRSSD